MKTSTKWNIGIAAILIVAAVGVFAATRPSTPDTASAGGTIPVVAESSHRLSIADDGDVTFVEFVDFECEVCGAAYPLVEQLREEYAGRVTFVVRYFPIPGHKNSMTSAVAVEAAAQQGKFEAMYQRMFETQGAWGEQQDSKAALFRTFAVDLGLDMGAYDQAVADPATQERVQFDFNAGLALGVQGTPTFFVDDQQVELRSTDDLSTALDQALAR